MRQSEVRKRKKDMLYHLYVKSRKAMNLFAKQK